MPAGWASEVITGNNTITFVSSTLHPSGYSAYNGTYMVKFNSFWGNNGVNRLKSTNPVSTIGRTNVMVDFAWLESSGYSTHADKVSVQWSTNGTTWNTAGTFYRYNAVQGWKIKNQLLPPGAIGLMLIALTWVFTSIMEVADENKTDKTFWYMAQYFALICVPPVWLEG